MPLQLSIIYCAHILYCYNLTSKTASLNLRLQCKRFLNFPTCPFRTPSEHATGPTNPADLQDFFNRIFKGGPPNDMSANGGFFPSGPPHHHPPGAAAPPFSPPPGQTGFYMPGSHRPESSETWAESGKPPRRRKKARKPFQR